MDDNHTYYGVISKKGYEDFDLYLLTIVKIQKIKSLHPSTSPEISYSV
jgi:hypothetical protein